MLYLKHVRYLLKIKNGFWKEFMETEKNLHAKINRGAAKKDQESVLFIFLIKRQCMWSSSFMKKKKQQVLEENKTMYGF